MKEISDEYDDLEEQKIVKELTKEKSFFLNLYNLAFEGYEGFDELKFIDDQELGKDFEIQRRLQMKVDLIALLVSIVPL